MDKVEINQRIIDMIEALPHQGIIVPDDLNKRVADLKTVTYYLQALQDAIRELYRTGEVGRYIDKHATLIEEQFGRAWREGMREVGMDPNDMTDEEKDALANEIDIEDNYVLDFADEILQARENKEPYQRFLSRAQSWANRYNDILTKAKLMADKDQKLEWVLGDAGHCASCIKLNGLVKRSSQWIKYAVQPQNAPNEKLECKGYNCKCQLIPTNRTTSRGKFPRLP